MAKLLAVDLTRSVAQNGGTITLSAILTSCRRLEGLQGHLIEEGLVCRREGVQRRRIDLVHHHQQGLAGKQRLDGVEQGRLLLDRVSALLADVHDVQHRRAQVRQGCDALQPETPRPSDPQERFPGALNGARMDTSCALHAQRSCLEQQPMHGVSSRERKRSMGC